jgi:hypothetical protein
VEDASRSSGLLRLEVSRARVSQFDSTLAEALRWVVHMASSRSSHGDQVEDGRVDAMGYVGPFYLKIVVLYVLEHMGLLLI